MKLFICLVVVGSTVSGLAFGADLHVPGDYGTIQDAVDAALEGDTILVEEGTYAESVTIGINLVLKATGEREATIIDGTGSGTGIGINLSNVTRKCKIRGFTISDWESHGISFTGSPKIIDCAISNNHYDYFGPGGDSAVGMSGSGDVKITDCLFDGNTVYAGGYSRGVALTILNGTPDISNCTFSNNAGGGDCGADACAIYLGNSDALISSCTFENNQISTGYCADTGEGYGAGIFATTSSNIIVTDCNFINNDARASGCFSGSAGGAIYCDGGDATISNSHFEGNTATDCNDDLCSCGAVGGAILLWHGEVSVTGCSFKNNEVNANNQKNPPGQAIYIVDGASSISIGDSSFCGDGEGMLAAVVGPYTDAGGNVFAEICSTSPADVNGDGFIDEDDLDQVRAAMGICRHDVTADGKTDIEDLLILIDGWGQYCGP